MKTSEADGPGEAPWFPDPRSAARAGRRRGLVAVGGELSTARLLQAYRSGIFPWTDDPVTWWSPDPRAIFELDRFHVPESLARVIRRGDFHVTVSEAFREVMLGCAAPARGRETTWISPAFIDAYVELHRAGHAHSVECWRDGELCGGIYGVSIGGFFAGESMFHRRSNASKVALSHLVERLRARGIALFDIQQLTPITRQLGAVAISRDEYLRRLEGAIQLRVQFA
jgi:leucyl/phenylalanyl-tRNA--protein transferase